MDTATIIFANAARLTFGSQLAGFLAAYALQTEVFYDILGGTNFLLLAGVGIVWEDNYYWSNVAVTPRLTAMTTVFGCSRGWLLLFLAWRAHNRQGDSRFDGVKDNFGRFLAFWMVQALWVLIISWPLLVVQGLENKTQQTELTVRDRVWVAGFVLGVVCEIVADVQKTVWVSAGRQGTFCTVGLWSYSRHPNYFGEIFQWWCAWGLSYGSWVGTPNPSTTQTVVWFLGCLSPLFSMHILLNLPATGIWNAEGKSLSRYYDSDDGEAYKKYRANTSPLIPMVGYQYLPLSMQRTFLFEWERFEYNPDKKKSKKKE